MAKFTGNTVILRDLTPEQKKSINTLMGVFNCKTATKAILQAVENYEKVRANCEELNIDLENYRKVYDQLQKDHIHVGDTLRNCINYEFNEISLKSSARLHPDLFNAWR